jgi:hypothetical protein
MATNELDQDSPVSCAFHMAARLEDECPWETCSKLWTHASWLDLLETIKTLSPDAYAALRRDLLKERT